jgi:hypothetical protein
VEEQGRPGRHSCSRGNHGGAGAAGGAPVTDEKSGGGGPQIRGCLDQERNRLRKLGLASMMLEWVKWAPHIDSKGMSTYIYMLLGLTFPTQPNKAYTVTTHGSQSK